MALILVVDDDDDIVDLLRLKLTGVGHDVITATDGRQGVDLCHDRRPDLVVMDWMMPVLDGVGALAEIRASPPVADTPVILLTARSTSEDLAVARDAGADDYVHKPFSPRDVAARVATLLDRAGTPGRDPLLG